MIELTILTIVAFVTYEATYAYRQRRADSVVEPLAPPVALHLVVARPDNPTAVDHPRHDRHLRLVPVGDDRPPTAA